MKCLDNIELTEFLDNETETRAGERIHQHLKSCPSCLSKLDDLKKGSQLLEQMKDSLNPSFYPEPSINILPLKRSTKKNWLLGIPRLKFFRPAYITVLIVGVGILLLNLLVPHENNIDSARSSPSSAQSMPKILNLEADGVPSDSIIFPDKTKSRLIVWVCKKNKET